MAQVTLQRDALNSPDHKSANSTNFLGQKNINGPHYVFEIGNLELFQNKELLNRKVLNQNDLFDYLNNKFKEAM